MMMSQDPWQMVKVFKKVCITQSRSKVRSPLWGLRYST